MPKRKTKEEFINDAIKIHASKYDYGKVEYINSKTKVCIICPEHGEFFQRPNGHLNGNGCSECMRDFNGKYFRKSISIFINDAINIHGNLYNYKDVDYINALTKVSIICMKHGVFLQRPNDHLNGSGCPLCLESRGERQIRLVLSNMGVEFISQYRFVDCRITYPLPFDFYIPSCKLLIEYDGEQHFRPVEYFGGITAFIKRKRRDIIKDLYCNKKDIKLLRISYHNYKKIEEIIKENII